MKRIGFFAFGMWAVLASGYAAGTYTPEQIASFLEKAQKIEPVQPSSELIRSIERSVSPEDEGLKKIGDVLVKDNLPYFFYKSQKNGDRAIIHPMRTGTFLLKAAEDAETPAYVSAFVNLAHELPNGGLAWYYPRHYNVSRMLGTHLKYSAISQGSIIAGLSAASKHNERISSKLAERAFSAMYWPFEKGGVNLYDVAVLEMPSFAGPPEIVLNGWLDALIHIRDYGVEQNDARAIGLFKKNIAFLAKILPNFDVSDQNISRYSDLSPYRVKATTDSEQSVGSMRVLYIPKISELKPILVPLKPTADTGNFSPYENQMFKRDGKSAFVWLSCSQLYDTVLVADSASLSLEMKVGAYDRKASTPGLRGKDYKPFIYQGKDISYAVISPNDGPICGYPTNFSIRGDENFYHAYHVAALLILGMGDFIAEDQKKQLIGFAIKWYGDIDILERKEGLKFRDLSSVLNGIGKGRLVAGHSLNEDLLNDALLFQRGGVEKPGSSVGGRSVLIEKR